ncbi:MAG TPA: dienelactone hydrolase family protein [Gammaproteobacteria bacterium]|nr:dienelactone hydrolase family protein [Gammaproteobacteria bacterium]
MRKTAWVMVLCLTPAVAAWSADMSDAAYTGSMATMHAHDTPAASPVAEIAPTRPVTGHAVVYATVNGKPVHGYLARPKNSKAALPGIIVIHEWWGLNDNIRHTAERLAGEGYTALAVDLYGGHAAATPEEAETLMKGVLADTAAASDNLRQAYFYLQDAEHAPRIGVIGWCFGGGWSLETALMLPDKLSAAVMYYGRPVDDVARLSKLKMPLLGLFGEQDRGITPARVKAFATALKQAHVKAEIHEYPGAGHAFANPSGRNYQAAAARDAWRRTVAFFKQYLQPAA